MTKADRLCIKVALWPVAIYALGLLGLMALRSMSGNSALPTGSASYVPGASLFVTFSAVLAANLLRVKLSRSPR